MTIARIVDDQVAEYRDITLDAVPAHKRGAWRTVEDVKPSHNAALEILSGPVIEVGETTVTQTWTAVRKPLGEQVAAVKTEAQRRIIALTGVADLTSCLVKQLNANMRANELNDKRLSGDTLTVEEDAEAGVLRDLAIAVKAIRVKSNEIEAMNPIPLDYNDDSYWT